ncbi:MAG: glycine--tRNA ligase subunit beta [Acidobacteria bacterium]|nr:glycine--tRNA ligase subunit beta [Acidobacteriota bacterium]
MSELRPFLFELGVEEIPHWMLQPAMADIERLFRDVCQTNQIDPGELNLDATPRRLVLRCSGLPVRQADREELVMGPPKSAGQGAAMGFAKKNGVAPEALLTEVTPKGEYFAVRHQIQGRELRDILAEALPVLISKIPWPKAMYWTGKGGQTFIRPIRWMVALFGDNIVEFEFAGVKAGALSRGHRRMGSDEIAFDHANYEERLEKNGVILSAGKRRKRIQDGIKKLLRGKGLTLIADDSLLNDIVYLTEYPTPILGNFDAKFLDLPQEVLSTVMRHHQRYFTLKSADGKMAPHFIAIMNMKADKKGYVVKGNERVLEARFNDGRFFWEVDRQRSLASRVPDLAKVTYQTKLNSNYAQKANGIREGAVRLASKLGYNESDITRAALLCKVDLTTELVKEMTELQGVMGGLYAQADGEPETVWKPIYEHYLPQSMDDAIPASLGGKILSIADKLDTLEGCFGIGLIPSGSKDPLGLRRAAQGVVKTMVEGNLRVPLRQSVTAGMQANALLYPPAAGEPNRETQLWEFFLDRIRSYFREVRGFAYDEVNAALAGQWENLPDVLDRLFALKLVRQTENFEPLAGSFKRIGNILKQAGAVGGTVNPSLLETGPELDLSNEMERVLAQVAEHRKREDYIQALTAIATLRPAVDAFFDKVLVNAPDAAVRANRLALLGRLFNEVSSIADFSEIVVSSTSE